MSGLIKYSDLAEMSLQEAVKAICDSSRIRYSEIKLSDLLLSGSMAELRLSDHLDSGSYGIGVYVFFDGNAPVYVGKARNFLNRLLAHRSIEPQLFWGWNAMLTNVCKKRLNVVGHPSRENLQAALEIVETFEVVRLLLDTDDPGQRLSRFERIIMKGIKCQSDTLLNSGIGKVPTNFLLQPLASLLE